MRATRRYQALLLPSRRTTIDFERLDLPLFFFALRTLRSVHLPEYFERALTSWELRAAMSLARASGVTRARCSKLATCSLRSTAGSLKGSTRAALLGELVI
jgi:hypothetical protein